jgi:hypothetical protein
MERPQPYPFHAFLSHAGADKPFVRALKSALEVLGWTTWLDEVEALPGRSLRQQLDNGLRNSRFGIVVLSDAFFAKRWPQRELDALFALEDDERTLILPVWLKLTEDSVRNFSAILSSRVAVISNGDAEQAAARLSQAMERILYEEGSWADILRRGTREGMAWARPPEFFAQSLRLADQYFAEFWQGRSATLPASLSSLVTTPSLAELFETTTEYAGKIVAVSGHQVAQQLLSKHDVGGKFEVHDYVIQVKTANQNYSGYLLYARIWELKPPGSAVEVPRCPDGHLATIVGVPIARGAMIATEGEAYSCIYLVAARIWYLPKLT